MMTSSDHQRKQQCGITNRQLIDVERGQRTLQACIFTAFIPPARPNRRAPPSTEDAAAARARWAESDAGSPTWARPAPASSPGKNNTATSGRTAKRKRDMCGGEEQAGVQRGPRRSPNALNPDGDGRDTLRTRPPTWASQDTDVPADNNCPSIQSCISANLIPTTRPKRRAILPTRPRRASAMHAWLAGNPHTNAPHGKPTRSACPSTLGRCARAWRGKSPRTHPSGTRSRSPSPFFVVR